MVVQLVSRSVRCSPDIGVAPSSGKTKFRPATRIQRGRRIEGHVSRGTRQSNVEPGGAPRTKTMRSDRTTHVKGRSLLEDPFLSGGCASPFLKFIRGFRSTPG